MSEPVVYRCTICEMPISGPTSDVMIGDGDGTGQRFAHGYCYWRREAGREKKRADDLEAIQRNVIIALHPPTKSINIR